MNNLRKEEEETLNEALNNICEVKSNELNTR